MVRVISPTQLVVEIRKELDDLEEKVDQVIQTSSRMGRDLIREYISTRPSKKSGKSGRIETGAMRRGVSYKKTGKMSARFGMKGGPEYSEYQENGFTHNFSGEWIEGMFAVRDAFQEVAEDIEDGLRNLT